MKLFETAAETFSKVRKTVAQKVHRGSDFSETRLNNI